ncbi:response regulator [Paraburkholderia sp. BCC1886]|uniref:response regulator n=1 Tax=Paraburkholderia sp. BCC1886 TaxID=2562670 RepID=UPI0011821E51|nr:response regulator [Paraburkholderia sp. BCC1886]
MSQRLPHEDENWFAVWEPKRILTASDSRTVVIAHPDIPVAETMALLLRLRGFSTIASASMDNLELMLGYWKPGALMIDTRMCRHNDFEFIRRCVRNGFFDGVLLIALTRIWPEEDPQELRRIGFGGLCRRPCPLWKLADMLHDQLVSN